MGARAVDGGEDRRRALALVPVSRETEERLAVYVDLLRRWQTIKNLVAPSTLPHVWTRHVADCAQLVPLAGPAARRWVDLGSGAGLPGLVVAIVLHDRPDTRVDLIESNERKCAFLREAVRATGARARVHLDRVDRVLPRLDGAIDAIVSRALAPLPDLLAMGEGPIASGATGLFMTGADRAAERAVQADPHWAERVRIDNVASRTHAESRIVVVRRRDAAA